MSKQFIAIVVVVLAALFGIFAITNKNDKSASNSNGGSGNQAQLSENSTGKLDSSVTVLEYSDFQCPACKSYAPLFNQLKEEYSDRVKFQVRHFPLTDLHPNAFIGSRAAEAAGKQGKFFEMYDLLYENQDSWGTSSNPNSLFEGYASELNLNVEQFKTDMNSSQVADIINADVKAGKALDITGTPTFVVNNNKLDKSPASYEEFKQIIEEELAKNTNQ